MACSGGSQGDRRPRSVWYMNVSITYFVYHAFSFGYYSCIAMFLL